MAEITILSCDHYIDRIILKPLHVCAALCHIFSDNVGI